MVLAILLQLCCALVDLSSCMSASLFPQGIAIRPMHSSAHIMHGCKECAGWQARREVDRQARLALAGLRARGLLSFRARDGSEEPTWAASERGRAVYESALPTRQGERLFEARPGRAHFVSAVSLV